MHNKKTTVCRIDLLGGKYQVVFMEAIDENIEKKIDNSEKYFGSICYQREDGADIPAKNIFLYGELDLNNPDDIENIEVFELIGKNMGDNYIYSNFNYENGTIEIENNIIKGYNTWNPLLWFKYCHCLIGKPKRIIVYKENDIKRKWN